jgi:hypothetical protein
MSGSFFWRHFKLTSTRMNLLNHWQRIYVIYGKLQKLARSFTDIMTLSRITLTTKTTITWHGVQRSVKQLTFQFDFFFFLKDLLFLPNFSFFCIFPWTHDSISISNNTHTLIHSLHAFNQCILHSRHNSASSDYCQCKCNVTHKYPPMSMVEKQIETIQFFWSYVRNISQVGV